MCWFVVRSDDFLLDSNLIIFTDWFFESDSLPLGLLHFLLFCWICTDFYFVGHDHLLLWSLHLLAYLPSWSFMHYWSSTILHWHDWSPVSSASSVSCYIFATHQAFMYFSQQLLGSSFYWFNIFTQTLCLGKSVHFFHSSRDRYPTFLPFDIWNQNPLHWVKSTFFSFSMRKMCGTKLLKKGLHGKS